MRWKKALIIPASLLLILILVAYAFLIFYDFSKFKPMIIRAVKETTGRELKIGGKIDVKLGLKPALLLQDISFQNAPWGSGPEMATVKHIEVQLALLPMIRGEFEFAKIVLHEPDFVLETNGNGKTNVEFETSRKGETRLPALIFHDVRVEGGRFTYKDGKTGKAYSVKLDRLNAVIPGLDQLIRLKFEGAYEGLPVAFEGTVGPIMAWIESGHPFPVNATARAGDASLIIHGDIKDPIHFKNMAFDLSAQGPDIPEIAGRAGVSGVPDLGAFDLKAKIVDSEGKPALEDLVLRVGSEDLIEISLTGGIKDLLAQQGLDLDFTAHGKDVANLTKPGLPPPFRHEAFRIAGWLIDSDAGVYSIRDLKIFLGEKAIDGHVDLNLAAQPPYLTVKLNAQKLKLGPAALTAELTGPFEALALKKLDVQIGTEQLARIKLTGTVQDLTSLKGVNLNFGIQVQDLTRLEELAGRPLPVRGAFKASGQALIPVHKKLVIPKLKITMGQNTIDGSLNLDLSDQKPRLKAILSSRKFALEDILSPEFAEQGWVKALTKMSPVKLDFTLAGDEKELTVEQFHLQAGNDTLAELELKGTVRNLIKRHGIQFAFAVRGRNATNLERFAGQPLPVQGAYAVTGQVNHPADDHFDVRRLEIVLGGNTLTGRMDVNLAPKRPQISASLSSQKLDFRPILKTADKGGAAKIPRAKTDGRRDKIFSSKPWSPDALNLVDLDARIRAKEILLPSLAFNNTAIDILLKSENLEVKPIRFEIGGGSANGRLTLEAQKAPPVLEVDAKIDTFDVGRMLDQLGYPETLGGNLNADTILIGSGRSMAELMAALDGKISVWMNDGRAAHKYLDLLENFLGTNVLRLFNPFKSKQTQTKVNCWVNQIEIREGIADCKLLLDTDQTSIFGAGDINLKTEALNLGIKPSPKEGFGLRGLGKIKFSLGELSSPFRMGGTLKRPSLALDPRGTAFTLGKFAGALALGPAGIAAFFADVSLGKKDPCLEALKIIGKEAEATTVERPENKMKTVKQPDETDPESRKKPEKRPGGLFGGVFRR